MWRTIALVGGATLALSGGVAAAATEHQITVNGTGGAVVPDGATNAQQQAAYDRALAAAITDAQNKAKMVAQQLSMSLGQVQSFTEESDDYLGYCGVGFAPVAAGVAPKAASGTSGNLTPIPSKHKRDRKKNGKQAFIAQEETEEEPCEIQADVTVVYSAA